MPQEESNGPLIERLLYNYIGNYRTVIAVTVLSSSCCLFFRNYAFWFPEQA